VKRLILLRHAKSSWSDGSLADAERPLSARGERDAPRMGERLRERGTRPEVVIASPARRARRTARLVCQAIGHPDASIRLDPALYLAAPDAILAVVAAQAGAADSVMIVGHNPGLTELANLLLPDLHLDNLPTTGVLVVDLDTDRWTNLLGVTRRLAYLDYPKNDAGAAATAD
jgi:phosphohistidine phosphatase